VTNLLQVDDVSVHFGGVIAVDEVSLAVEPGLLYGLVGPNGSGKSTLLGVLSRLTRPTRGRLMFDGRDYTGMSASATSRLGMARTFQTVRLLPTLSVLENVMVGADAKYFGTRVAPAWLMPWRSRAAERQVREAAEEALVRLGLTKVRDRIPTLLSYGTQRRVEIARALVSEPRLLLLDEPTAGMTKDERHEIGEILQQLRGDGLTQLLVDHDVDLMVDVSDHLFVMNFGRLIAQGRPLDVVRDAAVQEAYLGRRSHART
jgi:ABC-type branched-subunit amino acid transport system ATPase component